MRVIKPGSDKWEELNAMNALGLEQKSYKQISIVGAGGKTTTLEAIAADCMVKKIPAFVTTTTHMFYPDEKWVFTDSQDEVYIRKEWKISGVLWVGSRCGLQKIESPSDRVLDFLVKLDAFLLVEADGAKRLPFKVPGENEPVILRGTDCVLGVLGMDAFGCRIGEVCFRADKTASFLAKQKDNILTKTDYVNVIQSREGLQKGVETSMDFKVILNKADTIVQKEQAMSIRKLLYECGITEVYITSHK